MAYTIKGLAKANECETHDIYGLASIWNYWLACNVCDRQSINDFKRLRKADRQQMLNFLASDAAWADIHTHTFAQIYSETKSAEVCLSVFFIKPNLFQL